MSGMVPGPYFGWFAGYTTADIAATHSLISAAIEEDGPFDGLIGFSQGATLALSYLLHQEMRRPRGAPPFRFAVLFSCAGPAFSCDATVARNLIRDLTEDNLRGLQARLRAKEAPPSFVGLPSAKHAFMETTLSALLLGGENGFLPPSVVEDWIASSAEERDTRMPRLLHPLLTEARVRIPTAHIIGRNDTADVHAQAELCRLLCDPSYMVSATHGGAHDLPHDAKDVSVVCEKIRAAIEDGQLLSL